MTHYKVLGYILAASLFMAACAEDITEGANSKRQITFEATAQQDVVSTTAKASVPRSLEMKADNGKTYYAYVSVLNDIERRDSSLSTMRGAINDASTLTTNGFAVSAFKHTSGSDIGTPGFFYNESTTYASSKYSPSSNYYWPTDGDVLTFLAHYPQANATAGLTLSDASTANTQTITYEVPSSAANQPDLLVAKLFEKKYGDGFVTTDGKAAFDFKHALTAVKFVAGSIPDGTITSIVLKNVKCAGTFTYAIDGESPVGSWEFIQEAGVDKTTDFTLSTSDMTNSGAISGAGDISASGNILMMLPQSFTSTSSKIVVKYTDGKGGEHSMEGTLNGTTWDPGTTVTYTISIAGITTFKAVYPNGTNAWSGSEQGPISKYQLTTDNGNEAFGMYVADKDGNLIYSNIKMNVTDVASAADDYSATITADDADKYFFSSNYRYFLYYPYKSTYNASSVTPQSDETAVTNADTFFDNIKTDWPVETDQSMADGSKFRISDLQFQTSDALSGTTKTFIMKHKMGLVQFSIPDKSIVTEKKYLDKSGNTYTYVWTDDATALTAHASRTFNSASGYTVPFKDTGNKYYGIVKAATNTNFQGTNENTYPNADVPNNSWTESNVNIAAGEYSSFTKTTDITCSRMTKHTLAIGDIFYSGGKISTTLNTSKYGTPIGLVFYLGTTAKDKVIDSDLIHGYAMALKWAGGTHSTCRQWCTGTYQEQIATDGLLTPRADNGMGAIITTGLIQSGETEQQYRRRVITTDMEGLTHCKTAKSKSPTTMTAILKAESHNSYAPVPTTSTTTTSGSLSFKSPKTSGWYLPSVGQCYQWVKTCSTSITGNETLTYRGAGSAYPTTCDFCYSNPSQVTNEINSYFNNKGLSSYFSTLSTSGWWWWTSTENYRTCMFIINNDTFNIYFGDGRLGYGEKSNGSAGIATHTTGVWSVLAF